MVSEVPPASSAPTSIKEFYLDPRFCTIPQFIISMRHTIYGKIINFSSLSGAFVITRRGVCTAIVLTPGF